jgi:hypothetical protein
MSNKSAGLRAVVFLVNFAFALEITRECCNNSLPQNFNTAFLKELRGAFVMRKFFEI